MAELESVKQSLDSWREVAVILYSVITWEQVKRQYVVSQPIFTLRDRIGTRASQQAS